MSLQQSDRRNGSLAASCTVNAILLDDMLLAFGHWSLERLLGELGQRLSLQQTGKDELQILSLKHKTNKTILVTEY